MSAYFLSLLSGIGFLIVAILIAVLVLEIIGHWMLFEKANEKGWKSLIPFYDTFTIYNLVWEQKYFFIYLVTSLVSSSAGFFSDMIFAGTANEIVFAFIEIAFMLVKLYVQFCFCRKLSHAFGKGNDFAVGMFFFYPIFILILALGKAKFIGKSNEK